MKEKIKSLSCKKPIRLWYKKFLNKDNSQFITCPSCQEIFNLDEEVNSSFIIFCPICNHPINLKKTNQVTKKQSGSENILSFLSTHFIELILFIVGFLFLLQPTLFNVKIGFTLILIATILLFLMTEKKPEIFNKKIPISNKISIILIFWILFLFLITRSLEIYFILIFIGVLIIRELADLYITENYKKRLNAYIIIFLFAYILLIMQKIMEILSA